MKPPVHFCLIFTIHAELNKIIVKPPENFSASRAKDSIKNSYFTIQALKVRVIFVCISAYRLTFRFFFKLASVAQSCGERA